MAPPNLGDVVADRYELIAPLRGRATIKTFLALDDQIANHVALTWFDPAAASTAAWTAFGRVTAAASAAHVPGLVLPRGLPATPPDPPHCLTDVALGQGLGRLRAGGPVTWERALTVGERLVEILAAAHAATGVAHRALTPERCLVSDRDEVRVLDFGVAELERGGPEDPEYRAPEQPGSEDPRVDVYTVGLMLFELIAGQRPRAGDRLRSVVAVPPAVDGLLARALAAEPGSRFADYKQLRAALREVLELPPLGPAEPAPEPSPPPAAKPEVKVEAKPTLAPIAAPGWAHLGGRAVPEMTLQLPEPPRIAARAPETMHLPEPARVAARAPETTMQLPEPARIVARAPETTMQLPEPARGAVRAPDASFQAPPRASIAAPRRGASSLERTEQLPRASIPARESIHTKPARPSSAEPPTEVLPMRPIGPEAAGSNPAIEAPPTQTSPFPQDEMGTFTFKPLRRPRVAPAEVSDVETTAKLPRKPARPALSADPGVEDISRTVLDGPRPAKPTPVVVAGTRFLDDMTDPRGLAPMPTQAQGGLANVESPVPTLPAKAGWLTQRALITVNVVCIVLIIVLIALVGRG